MSVNRDPSPPPSSPDDGGGESATKPCDRRLGWLRLVPVGLWMSVIFTASGGTMSAGGTSRYFYPFFRWLIPGVQDETLNFLHFLFRKSGHVMEYAVLAALCWFAFGGIKGIKARWAKALAAWGVAVVYAASDEWRQSFVPSRQGAVADVALDAVGAALGIALIVLIPKITGLFRRKP